MTNLWMLVRWFMPQPDEAGGRPEVEGGGGEWRGGAAAIHASCLPSFKELSWFVEDVRLWAIKEKRTLPVYHLNAAAATWIQQDLTVTHQ